MIKFFRKIRQNLLSEGKTGKYLKYAIGEIFLVVIGILIALQINNWNTNRLQNKKERLLLNELHQEFVQNKAQLENVLFIHKRTFKSAQFLKSKLPINLKTENLDSLSYHIHKLAWHFTFNPSDGITDAISNSSSFDIISNNELRKLLISWNDVLEDYQDEEINAHLNYVNHLKPYEKKHFIYEDDYKKMLSDPRIDLSFLETLEFDNYVLDRYNDLMEIVNNEDGELNVIINTINRVIELSKLDTQ